jgi:hypothetical protein
MKIFFISKSLKSLKKVVGSGVGSGSISQRYGSGDPDPDPHQNVTDPQHWLTNTSCLCSLRKTFLLFALPCVQKNHQSQKINVGRSVGLAGILLHGSAVGSAMLPPPPPPLHFLTYLLLLFTKLLIHCVLIRKGIKVT